MCFCLQSQAYEFQFGLQYAWTMCIVAVSMTYSITCPIIMPFGEKETLEELPSSLFSLFNVCTVSPLYCNLALLYCLPVRCRLCEFAAVVPDTQTQ